MRRLYRSPFVGCKKKQKKNKKEKDTAGCCIQKESPAAGIIWSVVYIFFRFVKRPPSRQKGKTPTTPTGAKTNKPRQSKTPTLSRQLRQLMCRAGHPVVIIYRAVDLFVFVFCFPGGTIWTVMTDARHPSKTRRENDERESRTCKKNQKKKEIFS